MQILLPLIFSPTNPWTAALVGLVGAYADMMIFGQSATFEGQRMQDLQLQASTYGIPIPRVYGRYRAGGNIIWGTNYVEHREEESSGGKGGGNESTTITYTYSVSVAIGLHDGPITAIDRVWADGKDFPLYEIAYLVDPKEALNFSNVRTIYPRVVFLLTVKQVNGEQVLGVKDSDGNIYADASFGVSYTNSKASFTAEKTREIVNGAIYELTITREKAFDWTLYYGTEDQQPDSFIQSIETDKYVPAFRGLAYIVFKDFYVTDFGNRIPNFTFEIIRELDDLGSVINEITTTAGLTMGTDADLDTVDFYVDDIPGMMTTADDTYRAKLEKLAILHDFFCVETNGRIEIRYKRDCEDYFVPLEYFAAKEGLQAEEKMYDVTRQHDRELPRSVTVSYLSSDKDYQSGSMDAVRPTVQNQNLVKIDLNDIVVSDGKAKSVAEQKLYEAWVCRSTVKFSLPIWWAFLVPGDQVVCDFGSRRRKVQITKTTYAPPGVLRVEATDIGGNTYIRAERSADEEVLPSPRVEPSVVTLYCLDIPKLPTDTSTTINLYCAATGKPYYGAALYETKDGGASWILKGLLDYAATAGVTTTKLELGVVDFWDEANTVTVQLVNGTLESRPEIDVLNGYNGAVIGSEIVQFKTATLIAERTYRLSGLLRGRLGTEDLIGNHAIGERFVLLESRTTGIINSTIADWYAPRTYRIGPVTKSVTSGYYQNITFTNTARAYQPWSVCNVTGQRNESGDVTILWNRRDRSGGDWLDCSDIVMTEQTEKYEIDIMDGTTVKRTLTAYEPTINYTFGMQIADFGSLQPTITVRIYQISALRGRGVVKEATV